MKKEGFFFNMNTCIGCGACQVACKDHGNLQPGEFFRRFETIRFEGKDAPVYGHYSGSCNHCEEPVCVEACPTGAMYVEEGGAVLHNASLCIACGSCVWSCPYGSISFSQDTGYAQKCDSCIDLRKEGKEPNCCHACPTRSLRYGNLEEFEKEFSGLVSEFPGMPDAERYKPALRIKLSEKLEKEGI